MKLFVNRDKPAAAQEEVVTAAGNAPEKIITEVNDKVVAMLKRSGEAGELVLQTDNLVKKYRQRTVANHVSINVRQGEIVGLLGPNGAGKTTTFYMTTGLVTPNEGRVYINNVEITKLPVYKRAQLGIGYLPQEASVFRKLTVENNMELFAKYEEWGVAGCKIDFMDRQDQWMVNFYERVVKEAAKHHLLIDYHGAYKPAGLEQRYPNLLSYEGVRGLEQCGGCEPKNSIWLPFMRNAVGPMDFTPGAMLNAQPEQNHTTDANAMGAGTRAYQMALYVVFESGIQMLSDSPTRYLENPECTEFIASVPVTWDETRVLSAKAGDHLVVAKRKDNKWFIGAITGDRPQDINVKLDFLKGNQHRMTYFHDGVNANRQAQDYKKAMQAVDGSTEINMHLVRNGGWCAVIE